ncbi:MULTISPECIES: recombinase family protein [Streptomycetaceae]|uniref:Resolvase/invertase-type recombinase catalytic domain-containing protein n=1 Tax=Streptantibioticus cattleyicolor (strain ATCC 35852 / DSM 46488 / JCM 4925 / NBRC 14057 / NRRL 8057) TaxID=1003195 RepID=F8JPQ5_STREN|nr:MULTISPECIES: recombinase family protein [Streptomycetaceae]AEW92747.1 hypothetical protein SCATT_03760 [Streptantibioticus cattleyicolor NRRL 8057 = DSM 46488]MYS57511.1 recombinase family protein [Streptomyces sp. SID5468]CCB73101.1 protein of unknown function [Streptantibioticus cattleyicolor NRRL 8057 = DSM 46488]
MNHKTSVAYGYMRVFCDVTSQQVLAMEARIHRFAQVERLQLVSIYNEFVNGDQSVFNDLVTEVKRASAEVVIVPSLRHFSRNGLLQSLMLSRLEDAAGVEVLTLKEDGADREVPQ